MQKVLKADLSVLNTNQMHQIGLLEKHYRIFFYIHQAGASSEDVQSREGVFIAICALIAYPLPRKQRNFSNSPKAGR